MAASRSSPLFFLSRIYENMFFSRSRRLIGGKLGRLAAVCFLVVSAPAAAKSVDPVDLKKTASSTESALKYSQSAIGRMVGEYEFKDSGGQELKLSDFRGKPLILSLIYTKCVTTCSVITNRLDSARKVASEALGEDRYAMVTIGFDAANDTPPRMQEYARLNGVDGIKNWRFLSAEAGAIKGLASDLGFIFFPSDDGFTHLAQTTVIDADGKIFRQIYGETFDHPILIDGLRDLIFGTKTPYASLDHLIKKIRLQCIVYDPLNDAYRFDYTLFVHMAGGGMVIFGMILFIVTNAVKIRRRRKESAKGAAHYSPSPS